MEIKHITPREWDKVVKAGEKAIEGISLNKCRIRAKVQAQAEIDELNKILSRKRPLTNDEMVGRDCRLVKVCSYNLGTNNYPDMYKELHVESVIISRLTQCTVYESYGIYTYPHRNVVALIW